MTLTDRLKYSGNPDANTAANQENMHLWKQTLVVTTVQDATAMEAQLKYCNCPYTKELTQMGENQYVAFVWEDGEAFDTLQGIAWRDGCPDFYAITGLTTYNLPTAHIKQGRVYIVHECDQLGTPIVPFCPGIAVSYDTLASLVTAYGMIEHFFKGIPQYVVYPQLCMCVLTKQSVPLSANTSG